MILYFFMRLSIYVFSLSLCVVERFSY
uniref:Uncharacterized protein n=1 Tax=Rhizophora mucronata TaxID=61149 RepID=A0A2P2QI30_RHIMU